MVKPKESPELQAFVRKPVPAGYEVVKIVRVRGKTLRFHGKLLAEQHVGSRKSTDRWIELRLWATPAGAWIAELVRASDHHGEQDIEDALVIPPDQANAEGATMAMDFWNWINPARSLARQMGWKFEEFVE